MCPKRIIKEVVTLGLIPAWVVWAAWSNWWSRGPAVAPPDPTFRGHGRMYGGDGASIEDIPLRSNEEIDRLLGR